MRRPAHRPRTPRPHRADPPQRTRAHHPHRAHLPHRARRLGAATLVAGLLATLSWSSPVGADPAAPPGLPEVIDAILADPRLDGATAGVVVADADSGAVRYAHRPEERLLPASNAKLTTSAAALELLGPDHRFRTEVLTHGPRRGAVLAGDLYLRGTGDPTLLAADYRALAARVARAGITRVTGHLVADDTRFDRARIGRGWAADDESAYYAAPISALTVAPDTDYDAGSVIVHTTPGAREGDRPRVRTVPHSRYPRVVNLASTVPAGQPRTLAVERAHGGDTLTVSGAIPLDGQPGKQWVSVWEPTVHAATVFAEALAAEGVRVDGTTRSGRPTPADAEPVATHRSMPLSKLLRPFLKLSNNTHAEVLTKAIGYERADSGSWGAGLAAIEGYLRAEGVETARLRQVDGSGLSRMNALTAGQLARLLTAVRDAPWYPLWQAALPVACDPDRLTGGTLRSRMCDTPAARNARAKTGSLTGASALTGYVTDRAGRELAYSIVLNHHLAPSVKDIEDAIVVTLAASDDRETTRAPRGAPAADRARDQSGALECAWRKPLTC
ncbi:D-alanyl-D-alanine carboxypeptidase/D-alanyl-D-alanine endopeptidase [Streptomyces buecherae]|uniref:D-alanyl-D-alanine carboxypeptidase/D-alanyl-D-alanine endopeptidase n=1 Tax=Streptomyces buecherae TaxID=2763006 RepID=UPI0037B089B1